MTTKAQYLISGGFSRPITRVVASSEKEAVRKAWRKICAKSPILARILRERGIYAVQMGAEGGWSNDGFPYRYPSPW